MKILKTVDLALNKVEGALLILMLSVMVLVAFGQVMLRNIFHTGINGADILLRHLVLWIGFLGAAIATSEERHINIDALRRFLSPRIRSAVDVLTDLFAAIICFFLMNAAQVFVESEKSAGRMIFQNIPTWYAQVIIPVGFGLLVVHFTIRAVIRAHIAFTKGGAE
jgi:TRAP-type C4-dicarboxylate transport system permease small subunit